MTETADIKTVPNSKDSEMLVLGCMLTNDQHFRLASEELSEQDFFYTEHKTIFQALKGLYTQNKVADIPILHEELKRQGKLENTGGINYVVTLAQYAGTSAYIEEYIEILKNKSLLRKLISESQYIGQCALEEPENAFSLIDKFQNSLKALEIKHSKRLQIVNIDQRIGQFEAFLKRHRGNKYLGLRVKSIEELNEKLLGLRKLNLLAAGPNVGKTALTIQLALETLLTEDNACLVYISLEMTSLEIFTRMNLFLSELNFKTMVFGSQNQKPSSSTDQTAYFTPNEYSQINNAYTSLKKIGERIQIIDLQTCPALDSRTVINFIEALKARTRCERVIVVIDYLQVWPITSRERFPSENEADKWRIGEMKKIRDALNDDPVIVISEARKPSGKDDTWGGDLSDVMGSARGTYTPDVVMLISQLKPKALQRIWTKNNMPIPPLEEDSEGPEDERPGQAIKNHLANHGISLCKFEIPKARDGMQKFNLLLEFHFQKNIFKKVNWDNLRLLDKKTIKSIFD